MTAYADFLDRKRHLAAGGGFEPDALPEALYPFQRHLAAWALRQGRGAVFADTGLGKTLVELAWAEQVARRTGRRVLLLTPLLVAPQVVAEAAKFGIDAARSADGRLPDAPIVVANYGRLHRFDPGDFAGLVCDESSVLKDFKAITRAEVTAFARKLPYRLLATATPAPNDWVELGTSSEALGGLGFMDMLDRFFKNDQNNSETQRVYGQGARWRFKGHAEEPFWRWVASWAIACRRPSDLGYPDDGFALPPLTYREHVVAGPPPPGMLFNPAASGMFAVRRERRRLLRERCEAAAALVADTGRPAIAWCQLNAEGDLLEALIPGAVQIAGRDGDAAKEEKLGAFLAGEARVLVTKPTIGAWGLNLQHCAHAVVFPDWSFEQHYQAVRRCWRYGQARGVVVDVVATEGEAGVRAVLARKQEQYDRMFSRLIAHVHGGEAVAGRGAPALSAAIPAWLGSDRAEGRAA